MAFRDLKQPLETAWRTPTESKYPASELVSILSSCGSARRPDLAVVKKVSLTASRDGRFILQVLLSKMYSIFFIYPKYCFLTIPFLLH